jgi:hypothetical protein
MKPHQRRPEFDMIVEGWGTDNLEDLQARCELVVEYYRKLSGYTAAELKIANAMEKRLRELGGRMPIAPNTAKAEDEAAARGGA